MQKKTFDVKKIAGALPLIDWFGEWPSFKDAQLLELHISRSSESWMRVICRRVAKRKKHADLSVDSSDDKECLVTFHFNHIFDIQIEGFNDENVLDEIEIDIENGQYNLYLESSCGASGIIFARDFSVQLQPLA